jgi:hypothetical protein
MALEGLPKANVRTRRNETKYVFFDHASKETGFFVQLSQLVPTLHRAGMV